MWNERWSFINVELVSDIINSPLPGPKLLKSSPTSSGGSVTPRWCAWTRSPRPSASSVKSVSLSGSLFSEPFWDEWTLTCYMGANVSHSMFQPCLCTFLTESYQFICASMIKPIPESCIICQSDIVLRILFRQYSRLSSLHVSFCWGRHRTQAVKTFFIGWLKKSCEFGFTLGRLCSADFFVDFFMLDSIIPFGIYWQLYCIEYNSLIILLA